MWASSGLHRKPASKVCSQRRAPQGVALADVHVEGVADVNFARAGDRLIPVHQFPDTGLSLIGLVTVRFLRQLSFFNATREEAGWRGFALPRLQPGTSPMVAALSIAFLWPSWHLFLWQAEGQPVLTLHYWIEICTGHILFYLIIVWICNRAKGSILVAGITYAATSNAIAFILPRDLQDLCLTWSIAVLVMILADRIWKKLPSTTRSYTERPHWPPDPVWSGRPPPAL